MIVVAARTVAYGEQWPEKFVAAQMLIDRSGIGVEIECSPRADDESVKIDRLAGRYGHPQRVSPIRLDRDRCAYESKSLERFDAVDGAVAQKFRDGVPAKGRAQGEADGSHGLTGAVAPCPPTLTPTWHGGLRPHGKTLTVKRPTL